MPITGSSILVGRVVASLVRDMIATALVVAVALGIGWRLTASTLDWVAAGAMVGLFVTSCRGFPLPSGSWSGARKRPLRPPFS